MSDKVRQAVGAIIKQDESYLLVRKIFTASIQKRTAPRYDLLKGGVNDEDPSHEVALFREFSEELNHNAFKIIKEYDQKICFDFPDYFPYDKQETTMFLVEFYGDRDELKPDGHEVDEVLWVSKDELLGMITLEETLAFLIDNHF